VASASTDRLRVLVATQPGSIVRDNGDPPSRFAYYNTSAKGNDRFAGFTIDVMNQAAAHARLTLDLERPPHAEDRSSAINQLDRNETDMLGGLWAITVENIKRGADWTVPYHIGHVGALVKRVEMGDDIWGFFAPFTPAGWAFYFLLVLVYGLLTYALEQGDNEEFPSTEDPETKPGTVITELLWHCAMFSLRDRDKPIRGTPAKILSFTFSFIVVVVLASYTANLAAFMISATTTEHMVKSEEDLKSKKVVVLCGQSTQAWVEQNNIVHEVQCSQTMNDAVDMVKKGIVDAALGWVDELHYHAARDCDVEVSAITLHATEFSFPVARSDDVPKWRYKFNAALFRLRETGEFHKLRQKWFDIADSNCAPSGSESNPDKAQIKITNIIGLAAVLVMGLLCAGLLEVAQMMKDLSADLISGIEDDEDEKKVDVNPVQEAVPDNSYEPPSTDPLFKGDVGSDDEGQGLLSGEGEHEQHTEDEVEPSSDDQNGQQ